MYKLNPTSPRLQCDVPLIWYFFYTSAGAFGTVYQGMLMQSADPETKKDVAIKPSKVCTYTLPLLP